MNKHRHTSNAVFNSILDLIALAWVSRNAEDMAHLWSTVATSFYPTSCRVLTDGKLSSWYTPSHTSL